MNKIKPFGFQIDAIELAFAYFRSGKKGNPLVVAPTGSGKSVMIAEFCKITRNSWKNQKILILSDDAEILLHDYKAIKRHYNEKSLALYSAGLGSKKIADVTVAGIQSACNDIDLFKHFNIILLDEAHKLSYDEKSRYRKFFNQIKKPVIGFTATPFRLGRGYLHVGEDAFFDEIVFEISIEELQSIGRLCEIRSKQPSLQMDATSIKKQAGDFIIKELSMAFDRNAITDEIVKELVTYKNDRKKWLAYAIDIDHCEHIAEKLNEAGIKTKAVHSKSKISKQIVLDKFRAGEYQCLVSVAQLTTGVDVPDVDMIVLMRPTASIVLHIQIIGRGSRVHPEKDYCLVLDFAGNLKRNGPINKPCIQTKGKGGNGEPMMKVCEECSELVHIAVRKCPCCGTKFIFKHNLTSNASDANVIAQDIWHDVTFVDYSSYLAKSGFTTLKVIYYCGLRVFNEYISLERTGRGRYTAEMWWNKRDKTKSGKVPIYVSDALDLIDNLIKPIKIKVNESSKYPEIKEQIF